MLNITPIRPPCPNACSRTSSSLKVPEPHEFAVLPGECLRLSPQILFPVTNRLAARSARKARTPFVPAFKSGRSSNGCRLSLSSHRRSSARPGRRGCRGSYSWRTVSSSDCGQHILKRKFTTGWLASLGVLKVFSRGLFLNVVVLRP